MRATLGNLDERPCGPVGIAVNGVCEMHCSFLSLIFFQCNDASKREQTQTCLSHAEREHLRTSFTSAKVRLLCQTAIVLALQASPSSPSDLPAGKWTSMQAERRKIRNRRYTDFGYFFTFFRF